MTIDRREAGRAVLSLGTVLLAAALLLTGCGDSHDGQGGQEAVRAVVLQVTGDLTSVESFVVRTEDGEILELTPAAGGDFRFPLPHLRDHLRTLEPVLVTVDRSVDPPLATAIQDAGDPSWHGGDRLAGEPEEAADEPAVEPPPVDESRGDAEPAEVAEANPQPPPGTTEPAPPPSAPPTTGGGDPEPPPDTTAARPQSTTSPSTSTTAAARVDEPATDGGDDLSGRLIELVIDDGRLVGGARRETVELGDTVTLRVSGAGDDEVHVHGYDLFIHLEEGRGEMTFEASIPGVFEIELERSHTLLVRMEVS